MEREEAKRIIDGQPHSQTKGGQWRKTDHTGKFIKTDAKRPEYIVNSMWRELQRHNQRTRMRALARMDALVQKNRENLPDIEDEELLEAMKKDKARADRAALQRERRKKAQKDKATKEEWMRERENKPGLNELFPGTSKDWIKEKKVAEQIPTLLNDDAKVDSESEKAPTTVNT